MVFTVSNGMKEQLAGLNIIALKRASVSGC